jgi:glycosyltransferase involved in cell wall biosynthesis
VLTARFRDLPKESNEDGVAIERVRSFRRAAERCSIPEMISFLAGALIALPRVIRRDETEAAIIFFSFPSGPIGLLGRWIRGVPYVVSLRGGDVPGTEPHLARVHKMLAPLRRLVLRESRAIVANSDGLKMMAEAADPFTVRVIPNGVDTVLFQPAQRGAREGQPFRILFVGRFQSQKNLPLLLREVSKLPGGSCELHLVGDGPLRAELHALGAGLGIANAITWHGWLPREQLREVYRAADCIVNPSLYEGMPNVVLEAMACGKPVIASHVAGNDAVVEHGVTGLLFRLDEPEALGASLRMLMADRGVAEEMGRRGRKRVEEDYSWRRVADSYVQLFPACMSNPDNRAIYDTNWTAWLDMKMHGPASRALRSLITTRSPRCLMPRT